MSKKQELSKLALTAFLLAAISPTTAAAAIERDAQSGIFLAAKCGKGKCSSLSVREEIADNASDKDNPYNPKYNTYQMMKSDKPAGTAEHPSTSKHPTEETIDSEGKSAYGAGRPTQTDRNFAIAEGRGIPDPARASSYYNSYNVNHGGGDTTPTYMDSYLDRGYGSPPRRNMANSDLNRQYNAVSDYDYNRSVASTVNSSQTLNEAQLLGALNPQGRAIYLSLDPAGKALAIQLASEDSYRDKNLAIKEAQRRMNDRLGLINRY